MNLVYGVVEEHIHAFGLEYMINRLDKEDGEYQISFGVSDDMGGYRRKEIVCRYYDEENKIVLVQRNDITEDYESS